MPKKVTKKATTKKAVSKTKKSTVKKSAPKKATKKISEVAPENYYMPIGEAIDRIFEENFWDPNFGSLAKIPTFPKVDIHSDKKSVKITANIPGVDPDNISIELDEGQILIAGWMSKEGEDMGDQFHRYEREYGEFSRILPLPEKIDLSKVEANIKDGVLTIKAPKAKTDKVKKIKVKKVKK